VKTGNRIANANDERRRAGDFLRAADLLAEGKLFDRALSQTYYALYHVVRALLFTEGLEPRSHEGMRHLLNMHFHRTGKLAKEHMDTFRELKSEREDADYSAIYPNDEELYRRLHASALRLIEAIDELLRQAGIPLT